jgi:hypothetical protein
MPLKTDLDHFMQLRLARTTIAQIDSVNSTTPELTGFNRCRFIRYAIGFALESVQREASASGNKEK